MKNSYFWALFGLLTLYMTAIEADKSKKRSETSSYRNKRNHKKHRKHHHHHHYYRPRTAYYYGPTVGYMGPYLYSDVWLAENYYSRPGYWRPATGFYVGVW